MLSLISPMLMTLEHVAWYALQSVGEMPRGLQADNSRQANNPFYDETAFENLAWAVYADCGATAGSNDSTHHAFVCNTTTRPTPIGPADREFCESVLYYSDHLRYKNVRMIIH